MVCGLLYCRYKSTYEIVWQQFYTVKVTDVHSLVRLSSPQMYYNTNVLRYNRDSMAHCWTTEGKMWEGKAAGPGDVVTAERCSVSTGGLGRRIYNPEGGAFVMQIELPSISLCFNSVVNRLKYTTKCLRLWLWVVGVHTIPDALSRNPSCVIVESKLSLSQISADHVARHTSFSNVVICNVDVTSHSCCTQ